MTTTITTTQPNHDIPSAVHPRISMRMLVADQAGFSKRFSGRLGRGGWTRGHDGGVRVVVLDRGYRRSERRVRDMVNDIIAACDPPSPPPEDGWHLPTGEGFPLIFGVHGQLWVGGEIRLRASSFDEASRIFSEKYREGVAAGSLFTLAQMDEKDRRAAALQKKNAEEQTTAARAEEKQRNRIAKSLDESRHTLVERFLNTFSTKVSGGSGIPTNLALRLPRAGRVRSLVVAIPLRGGLSLAVRVAGPDCYMIDGIVDRKGKRRGIDIASVEALVEGAHGRVTKRPTLSDRS